MKSSGKEYLGMISSLYGCSVLLALPLYMKEGYWQIGDAKYILYRNITLICLLAGTLAGGCCLAGALWEKRRGAGGPGLLAAGSRLRLSWTDLFVTAYAVVNILSFLGSAYRETAWNGYYQWYMGLLTQLLLTGSYFLMSRGYAGSLFPLRCGQAALLAVSVLGILNRLCIDPLGLFQGMDPFSWDYTHLLSTVGNINWITGYLCVSIPIAAAEYLRCRGLVLRGFLFAASLSGLLLLVVQGSDSGLAAAGFAVAALGVLAAGSADSLRRWLLLTAGLCASFLSMPSAIGARQAFNTFPPDDKSLRMMEWSGWLPVLLLVIAAYVISYRAEFRIFRKILFAAGGGLAVLTAAGGVWYILLREQPGYSWGSGRGGLWAMALRCFQEGDWLQKLLGVGPDCYGEYVYGCLPVKEYLLESGHFENSVFANAHNEWLNQLVNTGILGLVSYGGIFISAFVRYVRRRGEDFRYDIGILALCLYAVNSLVSFQQVMNAPLLFLVLGICESRAICRNTAICGEADFGMGMEQEGGSSAMGE